MKTLNNIILLCILLFSFACSKDEDSKSAQLPEENPLQEYLANAGFNNAYTTIAGFGNYELGFTFKPLVNGKINSIVIKLPDVRNNIRVTLWDLQTHAILFEDNFNVSVAGIDTVFDIEPLSLIGNKEYVISMNTDSSYINSSNLFNPVDATYPITVGNISILNARSKSGAEQLFPDTISTSSYSGNCSFNFQLIE